MKMESTSDDYEGEDSIGQIGKSFLQAFVYKKKHECTADDSIFALSTSLLYVDLRQSFKYENGAAIILHTGDTGCQHCLEQVGASTAQTEAAFGTFSACPEPCLGHIYVLGHAGTI
ncbi:uncharacterized protein LOC144925719 isoform X2 [Branchiostoma floridae x Branchiostoma belcheri]